MINEHTSLSKYNLPSEGLKQLGLDKVPNLRYKIRKTGMKKPDGRPDADMVNSTGEKVTYALTDHGIKLVFIKDTFGWMMTSPVVKVEVSKGHWLTLVKIETENSFYELEANTP